MAVSAGSVEVSNIDNMPRKGNDIQKSMTIEFKEAAFGTRKQIRLTKNVTCKNCGGTGASPGDFQKTCAKCGGTGEIRTQQNTPLGTFMNVSPCPDCNGTGEINESPCTVCKGTGRVRDTVTINVTIPARVDNDSVIPIKVRESRDLTEVRMEIFTSFLTLSLTLYLKDADRI